MSEQEPRQYWLFDNYRWTDVPPQEISGEYEHVVDFGAYEELQRKLAEAESINKGLTNEVTRLQRQLDAAIHVGGAVMAKYKKDIGGV